MSVFGTILIAVLILIFVQAIRFWLLVKKSGGIQAYIDEKNKELDQKQQELDQEDLDDLIDPKSFNFILVGAIATLLFFITGVATGNSLYLTLMLFIITALVYIYYNPPHNKF